MVELVTKYILYKRFPKENEGFMTEKKIALVKNEAIGKIAYEMGLHSWFILSKHAESKQNRTNLKKLGCLFEAFIGALFYDFTTKLNATGYVTAADFNIGPGFQICQKFIVNLIEDEASQLDITTFILDDRNYKNKIVKPSDKGIYEQKIISKKTSKILIIIYNIQNKC